MENTYGNHNRKTLLIQSTRWRFCINLETWRWIDKKTIPARAIVYISFMALFKNFWNRLLFMAPKDFQSKTFKRLGSWLAQRNISQMTNYFQMKFLCSLESRSDSKTFDFSHSSERLKYFSWNFSDHPYRTVCVKVVIILRGNIVWFKLQQVLDFIR